MADYRCPHCGENVDTDPDLGGGKSQQYIEDCAVCCRPNRIHARYSRELDDYVIEASPDI
jgi:Cysteine-rich CPXCG